jgi:sugar lactone lactonase YvrE
MIRPALVSRRALGGLALLALLAPSARAAFVTFESGHVRPLALSPDGNRLYAVNTPDNRLEIFNVGAGGLTHAGSVPVGLEPVAVAARTNAEVWVVNHLSDSISIVDVGASPARVTRTLLVGDEPRDIVFAGPGGNRAFITTAHRGQNSPVNPQLSSPGVGRADVFVFDATNLGTSLTGTPLQVVTLFGDTPRALAVSPSGNTVYAGVFHSGNRTTTVSEGAVCDGGSTAGPCNVEGVTMPGGLPAPNDNVQNIDGPETGLIVKFSAGQWRDQLNRNWNNAVKFNLPDKDVFAINAAGSPPAETGFFAGVGTIIFNMIANPVTGRVYVTNTEARNEVRFEGPGGGGSTVRGHLHEARITILDGSTVTPRHLNKHINYGVVPAPTSVRDASLATPTGMAVSSNGATLYVSAFGSGPLGAGKVGVFSTATLESDPAWNAFTPSAANHIALTGGGASGLVLDEPRGRLYVFTRFDNSISVVNTSTKLEVAHLPVYNPEPAIVKNGRPFLYDAITTSSNGEAACAACHVFGDFDSLAWDLGNPDDTILNNPNPVEFNIGQDPDFHPLKGPMTTQSLRGMANHGPMHWRGDRTGGNDNPALALDEQAAFKKFNVAFDGLIGRGSQLTTAQMQAFTDFILQVTYPPNPIRALDNSLDAAQSAGRALFGGAGLPSQPRNTDVVRTCDGCHTRDPGAGFFGTDGETSFENEPQMMKIPHLRNMYQKVGMFGMPAVGFFKLGNNGHQGDQIRGFGFLHDGSTDTLFRFHNATVFDLTPTEAANMEQFMFAFDSNLAPIVGQQVTLTSTNSGAVGGRITTLLQRAAALECDVVVKGTLAGEQRGWVRTAAGTFQSDRAADGSSISDATLRAQANTAGQERTYTAVPPGSGTRIGIDRDEDGHRDRDELDAGSDPADPNSIPGGPTTTTTTTTIGGTTTTSTTLPSGSFTLIPAKSFSLKDDTTPPINTSVRKVSFKSSTKIAAPQNKIVPPAQGGADDPRNGGGSLTVYNSSGPGAADVVTVALPSNKWVALGTTGYRYSDPTGAIQKITVKPDSIVVKGGRAAWTYTLNEADQGKVALRLFLGDAAWCADMPPKATGNPPSTARYDRPGRYVAQPNAPAPSSCPALP